MYDQKMKEATYRWREKNKAKFNEYTNNLMKESYCPKKRQNKYLFEKECKIFRTILIDIQDICLF